MKLIAALCGLLLATPSRAAEITVLSQQDPAIVIKSELVPWDEHTFLASQQTPAVVVIKGELVPSDQHTFENAVYSLQTAIVFLESPGGSMNAGIYIGAAIKRKGFETAVADGKTCTSACAIAWLAGSQRWVGKSARVGFHQPRDRITKQVSLTALSAVEDYVRRLGLPHSVYTLATLAEPKSMTWLTETHSIAYKLPYSELRRDQAERYRVIAATFVPPSPMPPANIAGTDTIDKPGPKPANRHGD